MGLGQPMSSTKLLIQFFITLVIIFENINFTKGVTEDDFEGALPLQVDCLSSQPKNAFSWQDYSVLATMLIISCGVGVFYGYCGPNHENSDDFLLGGSKMGTFPMAMSLAASFVTAIELLGNPAEMYNHGSQFWMICIAFILVVPLSTRYYLPIFMRLRLTSSYEYLSLRFSPNTRYLASGLYIFQMVLYTSVAVYAPALALSKVTGLNVYLAVTAVYGVCIFYASQGGMKAVIIADTFQTVVLIVSLFLIVGIGERFIGGPPLIWSQSYNTGRLEIFNFDSDPTVRHSFWSVVVGGTFYWMTMFCSNQASIQKYLSVETIAQVKKAIWTSSIGLIIVYSVNFYTGMIMVAYYKDCDPLQAGDITAADEILPHYVITVMGHLKGITGFFVAGIFAASLGTVASALNSLAAVTMQDFLGSALGIQFVDKKGAFVAKALSIAYGALSFGLCFTCWKTTYSLTELSSHRLEDTVGAGIFVFVVAQLGSVMQVAISFNGMVGGITLGLFSLGMFFPWANSKGAIFGSLVAVGLITLMCIGQQISIANGTFEEAVKPTSIEKCSCLNLTHIIPKDIIKGEPIFVLFRISYIWYSAIGFLVTIIMGLLATWATGPTNLEDLDEQLISLHMIDFLYSLPTKVKEYLNIPLKMSRQNEKLVINMKCTELELETVKSVIENGMNGKNVSRKYRKISAP